MCILHKFIQYFSAMEKGISGYVKQNTERYREPGALLPKSYNHNSILVKNSLMITVLLKLIIIIMLDINFLESNSQLYRSFLVQ